MSGIENTAPLKRDVDQSNTSQIENTLKTTANRNLLRYAVGHAIFCPSCRNILDYRRAVLAGNDNFNAVLCTECWDKAVDRLKANGHTAEDIANKIDVIDGRTFGRRAK